MPSKTQQGMCVFVGVGVTCVFWVLLCSCVSKSSSINLQNVKFNLFVSLTQFEIPFHCKMFRKSPWIDQCELVDQSVFEDICLLWSSSKTTQDNQGGNTHTYTVSSNALDLCKHLQKEQMSLMTKNHIQKKHTLTKISTDFSTQQNFKLYNRNKRSWCDILKICWRWFAHTR